MDAFWDALRDCRLDEVTVDMVVTGALCNRGSFYYHFASITDLAEAALEDILTNEENIPGRLFVLSTGSRAVADVFRGHERTIGRLSLALRKGAYEMVKVRLVDYFENLWTDVLCKPPKAAQGEDAELALTDDARFVITYSVGALLSVVERYASDINNVSALEALFISEAGGVGLRNLSSAQNIPIEMMIDRLRGLERIERMRSQRRGRNGSRRS